MSQVAHHSYPRFFNIKRLGVFIPPPPSSWPEEDATCSPSQGYTPALHLQIPIYTPAWREAV